MRDHHSPNPLQQPSTILALAVCLLAGCATRPNADWNSRIGNFTYDQTIAELGSPDMLTKVHGRTVAVWVIRRSGGIKPNKGVVFYGNHADRVLRLTFDTEGRIAACSKNY